MAQHSIRNQIASLEAQVLSLRDSLATLASEQRALVGRGLWSVFAPHWPSSAIP